MSTLDRMIAGNGAMATRIRETDWSTHSLGPIEGWPATLHAALTTCLAARSPMHLWWGPQAIVFYNDASIPWLGARHPTALGRPAAELMPGRWDELSSAVQRVFVEGVVVEAAGIAIVPLAGTGGGVALTRPLRTERAERPNVAPLDRPPRR